MSVQWRYRFHVNCARLHEQSGRFRSARSHWQQAETIEEQLPPGKEHVPVFIERIVYGYCRLVLLAEYIHLLVSGRLDQAD